MVWSKKNAPASAASCRQAAIGSKVDGGNVEVGCGWLGAVVGTCAAVTAEKERLERGRVNRCVYVCACGYVGLTSQVIVCADAARTMKGDDVKTWGGAGRHSVSSQAETPTRTPTVRRFTSCATRGVRYTIHKTDGTYRLGARRLGGQLLFYMCMYMSSHVLCMQVRHSC
jgi:hypothetical protein